MKLLNILLQSIHVVGKFCARYLPPTNLAYVSTKTQVTKRAKFLSRKLVESEECNKIQASASVDYRLPENLLTWYIDIADSKVTYNEEFLSEISQHITTKVVPRQLSILHKKSEILYCIKALLVCMANHPMLQNTDNLYASPAHDEQLVLRLPFHITTTFDIAGQRFTA